MATNYATITRAPGFTDEGNLTVTYQNPLGNSVTKLEIGIFNEAGTQSYVPYREISKTGTSYPFPFTEEERNNLRRAFKFNNYNTIRYYLKTTIGSNVYYHYVTRELTIVNADPKITATVKDTNSKTVNLTGDDKKLIKGYSTAYASMTVEPQKYAVMNEDFYRIDNVEKTHYGKNYSFEKVGNCAFTFSAEDSRQNIGTAIVTPEVIDYIPLTCNIEDNKPDAQGKIKIACSGNFFNGSFGELTNTLGAYCRYTVSGNTWKENWQTMNVTKNDGSYYAYLDVTIDGFSEHSAYVFEIRVNDRLEDITKTTQPLKATPIFHWGEDDFTFEVPVAFNGKGEHLIKGDLRLKGDSNYGQYLLLGDGYNCYLNESADNVLDVKANRLNLNASNIFANGSLHANSLYINDIQLPVLEHGSWTPVLDEGVISSYTTRGGWYCKLGKTVTVGFYIKCLCYTACDGLSINIYGSPYAPIFAAAGGGMASGVYISGGYNFQCFVAETSGTITTRVQACNNTAATNLSTSSSGCNYRKNGGEITLSGTITFRTKK